MIYYPQTLRCLTHVVYPSLSTPLTWACLMIYMCILFPLMHAYYLLWGMSITSYLWWCYTICNANKTTLNPYPIKVRELSHLWNILKNNNKNNKEGIWTLNWMVESNIFRTVSISWITCDICHRYLEEVVIFRYCLLFPAPYMWYFWKWYTFIPINVFSCVCTGIRTLRFWQWESNYMQMDYFLIHT